MSELELTFVIEGETPMVEFGQCLGRVLKSRLSAGATVFLLGDLGAGKTTMSRGILQAFGHSGPVKSPTYTLVEPYEFEAVQVNHFDLYRLGDPEELEYMGIRDYFSPASLSLVEWPHRGEGFLPQPDIHVTVTVCGSGRQLLLCAGTNLGEQALVELQSIMDIKG